MISVCDNNSICDITNLKDNKNKKGLLIPVILKVRTPLYKTKINIDEDDNIRCSGEGCINDNLMDIFLYGKKTNEKTPSVTSKTKKNKRNLNKMKPTKQQPRKTKKNKKKK
tara:strand:+ start:183 stop:515 length:333 start_codon:yes stop_codon:yes gene_type:complete